MSLRFPSGRSLCSLGSPLNARPSGGGGLQRGKGSPEGPRRGAFLPVFLVIMLLLITATAGFYLLTDDQVRRRIPMSYILKGDEFHRSKFGFPDAWVPGLFVLVGLYNLVCAIGILQWQRWGLLGFVAAPAAVFVVNAAAGVHVVVMSGLLIPGMYAFFSSAALIGGGITGRVIARKRTYPWWQRYIDNEVMASWVGDSANDLIAIWGSPNRVMDDGEGGKIFIYIFDRASSTPAKIVTREFGYWFDGKDVRPTYRPSEAARYLAFRMFWINPQNIVYRWAWTGE